MCERYIQCGHTTQRHDSPDPEWSEQEFELRLPPAAMNVSGWRTGNKSAMGQSGIQYTSRVSWTAALKGSRHVASQPDVACPGARS